jgi:carboxymethylenebutenolidase
MCIDHDSRPPIEPIAGGALDTASVILHGADGSPFRSFSAEPEQPASAAILILPDVRGLHPFFEELALRYAENGIGALAIDYFGRTAGTTARPADYEYQPDMAQVTWSNVEGDIRAAVAELRRRSATPRALFASGFCFGGRMTSLAATLGLGLAGVIPYYGWPVGESRGSPAPADIAARIECPVLAIYGGADQGISGEVRDTYDRALAAAGVPHRTIVYDGAPHSFFDRKAAEYADAAAGAWAETLAFIRERSGSSAPAAG